MRNKTTAHKQNSNNFAQERIEQQYHKDQQQGFLWLGT